MTIERQLDEYGHHLRQVVAGLEVELDPDHAVRPVAGAAATPRPRWMLAAAAAAVVAVVAVGSVLLLRAAGGGDPAPVGVSGASAPTTAGPAAAVPAAYLEPALLEFTGVVRFARSGEGLWVWDGVGHTARYSDGFWLAYPTLPGEVRDVAEAPDGTVWALITGEVDMGDGDGYDWPSRVFRYRSGAWTGLTGADLAPGQEWVDSVAVDQTRGVVWTTSTERLYRWDGEEVTVPGRPPFDIYTDIEVTADGSVWGSGVNFYIPQVGGLVRYDPAAGSWESVRPLGGDEDVPAQALAVTPGGNLWVLLADWHDDHEVQDRRTETFVDLALAYFDAATGEWTVYRDALLQDYPTVMAADDEAVWLAGSSYLAADRFRGVVRFDGETWTRYLEDRLIDGLGIGSDGSVWVTVWGDLDRVHRLVIEEEAGS